MKAVLPFIIFLIFNQSVYPNNSGRVIRFNHKRGFYYKEFILKLSFNDPEAVIKYTTDGSEPGPIKSLTYSNPIKITTTTIIKATAFIGTDTVSETGVNTFIFPEKVIRQPKNVNGYPGRKYPVEERGNRMAVFDTEMDPDVVFSEEYKDSVIPGLLSLPSVVIGIDPKKFWVFYNGNEIVRTSIEVIYPDKKYKNEQIFCGIRSRSHKSLKRSVRVLFKREFGSTKFNTNLLKTNPLNSENATGSFDHLIFRAGFNRSWAWVANRGESAYTRDQWYRDTQLLMSGDGLHGTFAHLYVNGLYWGLYNIAERADENFLEEYYGGKEDNWYSASTSDGNGDSTRYNYI